MKKPYRSFTDAVYNYFDIDCYEEFVNNPKYKELHCAADNHAFLNSLSEEQKVLFQDFEELETQLDSLAQFVYFSQGFKLGVRAGDECASPKELSFDYKKGQ